MSEVAGSLGRVQFALSPSLLSPSAHPLVCHERKAASYRSAELQMLLKMLDAVHDGCQHGILLLVHISDSLRSPINQLGHVGCANLPHAAKKVLASPYQKFLISPSSHLSLEISFFDLLVILLPGLPLILPSNDTNAHLRQQRIDCSRT